MSVKVTVQPQLLRWARQRASLAADALARKVGTDEHRVHEWERTGELTLARLERVASSTYTPVGYLLLSAPPRETLPISDFRTPGGVRAQPSPDLLDTIYLCQQRQSWYRDHLIAEGEDPLPFVGSATPADPPRGVAGAIRATIGLAGEPGPPASAEEALRALVEKIEAARILVMRSGVVGNNTRRKLDPAEFRGFALSDEYAPLVFVNATDSNAAKMFTLAHELGHLWLGQSGVSDADPGSAQQSERFCNGVAAEVLVPIEEFRAAWRSDAAPADEARRLARVFRVSSLVVLIRAREAGALSEDRFKQLYAAARSQAPDKPSGGGGDFYRTQGSRLGKPFARAVIVSALEGTTTYKEAFQLLGLKKSKTFDELARSLGVTR